jgi:anti-sigma factor RsiW
MGLLSRLRDGDPLVCQEFVELVTDYLEDALSDSDRRRFEAHLADCRGCKAYFASLRLTIDSLHALPPEPPDPHTRAALLAAFRDLRP